ncbi:MAG: alpha/beta hydrolase family protein [Ignavibacteriales bacterium]
MSSLLIDRKEIELNQAQLRMIKSGWGEDAVEGARVEKMTYSSDHLKVKGFIAYPKQNGGQYPCIIWNRGGIGNQGTIDDFTARGIFGQIASWGYVVLASQYRGNAGGEGRDQFGGDDVNDVLNLIPLADEIPIADKTTWGIEGWSRGGMMTYLALTRSNAFKAAVISGGIANLRCTADESRYMRLLYEKALGEYGSQNFRDDCEKRSIVNIADRLPRTTSFLLLHGTADDRVSPRDSLEISGKMLEYNIPFRLVMLEGGDHFLRTHKKEVDEMRRKWFNRYLKPGV